MRPVPKPERSQVRIINNNGEGEAQIFIIGNGVFSLFEFGVTKLKKKKKIIIIFWIIGNVGFVCRDREQLIYGRYSVINVINGEKFIRRKSLRKSGVRV